MTTNLTCTHQGIDIAYDEHRNLWCFTLRGRDRSALGLAEAREAIDEIREKEAKLKQKLDPLELPKD